MATFGPIERSYQELMYRTGDPFLYPSPPKSTFFHLGSFGCRLTKSSQSLGAARSVFMMLSKGSVQTAPSITLPSVCSSISQTRASLIIWSRVKLDGKEGL